MINSTELILDRLKVIEANSSPEKLANFLNTNWARVDDLTEALNTILDSNTPVKVQLEFFNNLKDMLNKYKGVKNE